MVQMRRDYERLRPAPISLADAPSRSRRAIRLAHAPDSLELNNLAFEAARTGCVAPSKYSPGIALEEGIEIQSPQN
jgi:hypothetical protein